MKKKKTESQEVSVITIKVNELKTLYKIECFEKPYLYAIYKG